jgi:hypothetical protein
MQNGGYAALLHLLMSRDISSFEVRTVPQTRALREQKQLSQEPHEAVFLEMLRTGVTPDPDPLKDALNWVSVECIVDAIADRRELPKNRKSLQTKVGLYLRKFVEVDKNGNPFSVRVKRMCTMSGSRAVGEVPEEYRGPVNEIRRTMYRLRPLHDRPAG